MKAGGFYDGPRNVICRAASEEEACAIFYEEGYFGLGCECCGPRWFEEEAIEFSSMAEALENCREGADPEITDEDLFLVLP